MPQSGRIILPRLIVRHAFERNVPRMGRVGSNPNDVEETRLHQTSLVSGSLTFILAGFLLGLV